MGPALKAALTEEMLKRFAGRAAAYDQENRFFQEDFEELRASGYLRLPLPKEFGGEGLSLSESCRAQRQLAHQAQVLGGSLRLGADNALQPATTNLTVSNGAVFDLNSHNAAAQSLSGLPGSSIILGGATLTINQTRDTTFGGVLSGAGGFVKGGPGVLTLGGANTYAGVTTIAAGTLLLNGSLSSFVVLSDTGTLGPWVSGGIRH